MLSQFLAQQGPAHAGYALGERVKLGHRTPCPLPKCYSSSILWINPPRNSCAHCTHSPGSMRRDNTLTICNNPSWLSLSIFWTRSVSTRFVPVTLNPSQPLGARCHPSDRRALQTLSSTPAPYLWSSQRVAIIVHHTRRAEEIGQRPCRPRRICRRVGRNTSRGTSLHQIFKDRE
jgi:hypothetical protein